MPEQHRVSRCGATAPTVRRASLFLIFFFSGTNFRKSSAQIDPRAYQNQ
eukprot:COSAG06_NODE_62770_length_264_cov_0.624242_1_plen_48_part_10